MEMVILNNVDNGRLTLTNNTPDQEIILRHEDGDIERAYAPWDTFSAVGFHSPVSAAFIVHNWACEPCRTKEGIEAARQYLRRWPEGPQAEIADIHLMNIHRRAMMDAASELAMESPPLDELSIVDRCVLIRKMAERLKEFQSDSVHAYILRMRISAAASLIQVDLELDY